MTDKKKAARALALALTRLEACMEVWADLDTTELSRVIHVADAIATSAREVVQAAGDAMHKERT